MIARLGTLLATLASNFGIDERARRLATSIVTGMVGRLATLVAPLIVMPVMLRYLGDASFGVWVTAISVTSVSVFLDLGIGNGLLTRLSAAFGRDDFVEMQRYIASAYALLCTIMLFCVGLSTIIYIVMATRSGTNASVTLTYAVLVAYFAALPAALIHQILYAVQRVGLSSMLMTLGAFAGLIGCLCAVHFSAPPWFAALAYSVPSVVAAAAGALYFFTKNERFRPRLSCCDWSHARDLLSLGSHFLILSILMAVSLNSDNIIISWKAGAGAVAAYSLPTRLGSVLGLLILNLFMPLWGANGEALSRGEFVWVKRGAWRMAFFGTLFVSLFGIAMVLAGNLIMDLWVGRSFKNQEFVLIFVVASAAVTATTAPYNMILNALGRADLQILPWICFACLTIGLKLILVSPDRIWYASAITFFAYSCTIMPAILLLSKRALRRASERAHPVAAELPIPR